MKVNKLYGEEINMIAVKSKITSVEVAERDAICNPFPHAFTCVSTITRWSSSILVRDNGLNPLLGS